MISQSRYIKIVSGVGAGAAVAERQLVLRLLTQNSRMPPGVVAEFTTIDAVGAFFLPQSEEYKRAQAYFSFISKNIKSPRMISFARWVSSAIPAMVIGDTLAKSLPALKSKAAGELHIVSNDVTVNLVVDLSAVSTLTEVAAALQTAIRASTDPNLSLTSTVVYMQATNQFILSGAHVGEGTLAVTPTGSANDIGPLLGWGTTGTVLVEGQAADTPDQAVAKSAAISNNFGSFAFTTPAVALTVDQIAAISAWNDAQNDMYLYSMATTIPNAGAVFAATGGFSGTSINLLAQNLPNDFPEQSPCEILAATDYNAVNATQNFMYYQFPNRNVVVSDDSTADQMDLIRANYIGVTQQAGQPLAFYQRGVLCGGAQAAVDTNTYCNEMWLKASFTTELLSMFLNLPRIPANDAGKAIVLAVMQSVINRAKDNGTISAGKAINTVQQQFITQISNDPNAWRQIATIGYWISIDFRSEVTPDGRTEWYASYQLIYSKDDAIRSVRGSDVMI